MADSPFRDRVSKKYVAIGMTSIATASEARRVVTIDTPIFLITSLIRKFDEKIKGRNTITVVRVDAKIDRHTSVVPCFTESSLLLPEPARR